MTEPSRSQQWLAAARRVEPPPDFVDRVMAALPAAPLRIAPFRRRAPSVAVPLALSALALALHAAFVAGLVLALPLVAH